MRLPISPRPRTIAVACIVGVALTGCAAPRPIGPTVMALPPEGENFATFQQHDSSCQQYAASQIGGQSPGQAAERRGIAGAALGTGIGAAAGALLGSASGHAGGGAAIGAGSGLLAGTLLGSAHGRGAAASLQERYNVSYTQCMVANGEHIAPPAVPRPVAYVVPPPPPVVYVPALVYPPPPPGP